MWNPPLTCLLTKLGQLDTNILVVQLVVTTVAPVKSVAAVGVCSPIKVELWASHDGLVQAWVLGKTHVAMEVDSTLVMRLLSPHSRMVASLTILQHIFAL
ncbi:hypothetical protein V6N13_092980 [Hibiscus sabdariffa]